MQNSKTLLFKLLPKALITILHFFIDTERSNFTDWPERNPLLPHQSNVNLNPQDYHVDADFFHYRT